jgi:cell wall-associated NlpC family hydrolase
MKRLEKLLRAVDLAREWRYETRGTEPGGVGCVGFALYLLRALGHQIPDYHYRPGDPGAAVFYANYHKHADPIKAEAIEPGDVVFMRCGKSAHLGIYAGGGRVVHMTRSNGVVFQRMDLPPMTRWDKSFYRVRETSWPA